MAMSDWLDREHMGHAFPTDTHGHDVIYCGHCGLESCFWSQCPCMYTDEQAAIDSAYADRVEAEAQLHAERLLEWSAYRE